MAIGTAGFIATLLLVLIAILKLASNVDDTQEAELLAEREAAAEELRCWDIRRHSVLVGDLNMPARRVSG
jgi:hypothetical protein